MPNPLVPPPPTGIGILDRWLALLWRKLTAAGEILWTQVSKAGSNLTDIETRNHADLQNLNTASYTHLTATNHTDLTDGGQTSLHKHDHAAQDNLNSASYTHLTATQATDLTDAGDTLLHYHLRHDVTGILTGGVLSVSVGGTTFSITDGTGQVVNNYTSPLSPTITPVSWSGKTNVTDTLLSDPANYILIDSTGAVTQQATAPTDDELREKILVGVIAHSNNLIIAFAPLMVAAYQNGNLSQDMLSALGTITNGCAYSGNAALTMARTSGSIFRRGAHYLVDTQTPNSIDLAAQNPVQFASYCRNGSNTVFSNSAVGTTLTVNRYDDGTAAAAGIPNGVVNNNQWQAIRLFLSTNSFTLLQYGQQVYNSLDDAVAGVTSETWFQAPITRLTAFRGYLFVRGGATVTNDIADAFFQTVGKLGDIASSAATPTFDHDHNTTGGGGVLTNDEHDGYIQVSASSAPSTPSSGNMRLYVETVAGTSRLRAIHPSGSDFAFFRDAAVRVRNQSGSTITKMSAVYISGVVSGIPTVALAQANSITTSNSLGLVINDIPNADFGAVQFGGVLSNLNTSGFSAGDNVYLSPSVAGGLTATEPSYPNLSLHIGVVLSSNASTGTIFVYHNPEAEQGGQAAEHFTLTSAEYTGTGTGVFARKTGGAIDPASIGAVTPGSGAFTTLSSTGNTTLGDASTDTLTITGTAVSTPNGLNFDSNTLVIDAASDRVIRGNAAAIPTTSGGSAFTPNTQILGTTAAASSLLLSRHSNDVNAPGIFFLKNRATSFGSHTAVQTSDVLFRFSVSGDDGAAAREAGRMDLLVDGAVSSGIIPGRWSFYTTNSSGVVTEAAKITSSQSMVSVSPTGGLGYGTGAGGTVTQLTSKATGVTLNKVCGQITTASDSLAANTRTSFTLTNSAIASTDSINIHRASGGTANSYRIEVDSVAAGSCVIAITNITAGALSEAVLIEYAIIKGVTA